MMCKEQVFNGKVYKSHVELCKEVGINIVSFRMRLRKGYSVEDAVRLGMERKRNVNPNGRVFSKSSGYLHAVRYEGRTYPSIAAFARSKGMDYHNAYSLLIVQGADEGAA